MKMVGAVIVFFFVTIIALDYEGFMVNEFSSAKSDLCIFFLNFRYVLLKTIRKEKLSLIILI